MSKHLQREMDNLQGELLNMASSVEWAVRQAVQAVRTADASLGRQVIEGDAEIDREENRLGEECLKVLALHQPVAIDLRRTTAVMRMTTELEQVGDLAEEIAESAVALAALPPAPTPSSFGRMAELATGTVRRALDAFVKSDVAEARCVLGLVADAEGCIDETGRALAVMMRESPARLVQGLALFSAARSLGMIAEHAAVVAEDVIYLINGEILRHRLGTRGRIRAV